MGKWQPIETAPKDGTAILLFVPNMPDTNGRPVGMNSQSVVGIWRGRQETWNLEGLTASTQWACDVVEFDHGYYPGEFDWGAVPIWPTHWMPLPAPPSGAEG